MNITTYANRTANRNSDRAIQQRVKRLLMVVCVTAVVMAGPSSFGQDTEPTEAQQKNYEKFEKMLNNVKLVGSYTIIGRDDKKLREEVYVIEKVTKMKEGNLWSFKARIKFGPYDYSAPIPLNVEWAGDTPVITLTDVTIPTLGTFDSRIVFNKDKYAGTWSHGDVGGHMFGRIVPIDDSDHEKPDHEKPDHEKPDKEKVEDSSEKKKTDN